MENNLRDRKRFTCVKNNVVFFSRKFLKVFFDRLYIKLIYFILRDLYCGRWSMWSILLRLAVIRFVELRWKFIICFNLQNCLWPDKSRDFFGDIRNRLYVIDQIIYYYNFFDKFVSNKFFVSSCTYLLRKLKIFFFSEENLVSVLLIDNYGLRGISVYINLLICKFFWNILKIKSSHLARFFKFTSEFLTRKNVRIIFFSWLFEFICFYCWIKSLCFYWIFGVNNLYIVFSTDGAFLILYCNFFLVLNRSIKNWFNNIKVISINRNFFVQNVYSNFDDFCLIDYGLMGLVYFYKLLGLCFRTKYVSLTNFSKEVNFYFVQFNYNFLIETWSGCVLIYYVNCLGKLRIKVRRKYN
uniref:E5357611-dcd0-4d9a-83f4-cf0c59d9b3f0-CDS n=1 Tax=Plasmodiophora brassicae TaxID=37360 RepID=A0A3P3YWD1_PLABS|nr:e5357611-dcd0-4d9a-83f4-cf0c59d9b3f0-CDS [Plasmodiophora brassicae]